jgi:hypothetical protein
VARENGDNGDLQRASCGTGSAAQAESARRPSGGPDSAWRRAEGGLLLLAGALRLLEERVTGTGIAEGQVGENFTIDDGGQGLLEESVPLGDRISIGTAEVTVTQPRMPCYKLG